MKEIIVDSNIFTHLKRDLKDGYDGTGNKKTDEEIIDSSFLNLKSSVNRTKGIVKIRSSYDIDTYAKFLNKTYNSLKFLRKLKEDTINCYAAIYPYIFNSELKNEKYINELDERALRVRRMMMLSVGDNKGLADNNSNKSEFFITKKNNEIFFQKNKLFDDIPTLKIGNIDIEEISEKSISHINIKTLPLVFKQDINIHPSLSKNTLNKSLIESQFYSLYSNIGLTSLPLLDFSHVSSYWDENDIDFIQYIKEGEKYLSKIKEIHDGILGPNYFLGELNYRVTIDSINSSFQLMELYINSADSIRDTNLLSEEVLKNLDYYKKENKLIEELIPQFPITFLIPKNYIARIKEKLPHFFNTGKKGLSFFE